MKKFILSIVMVITSMTGFAQQTAFQAFVSNFSKSAAFASVQVGNRPLLLVSHETFGNNENTDLQAIETSIFALDSEGKIVALGSIRSQGTLYPVSVTDSTLMVAGHHFVREYSVRGEMPELELTRCEQDDSPQLEQMFAAFEQATPVMFKK